MFCKTVQIVYSVNKRGKSNSWYDLKRGMKAQTCSVLKDFLLNNTGLIVFGKLFHKTAVDVSNSLFPYHTVLLRFGTSNVVDADRNVLAGVYQCSKSLMYVGICE